MKRAISVASVTSKKSSTFFARSRASCCMVWSISVSPITTFPSSMVNTVERRKLITFSETVLGLGGGTLRSKATEANSETGFEDEGMMACTEW